MVFLHFFCVIKIKFTVCVNLHYHEKFISFICLQKIRLLRRSRLWRIRLIIFRRARAAFFIHSFILMQIICVNNFYYSKLLFVIVFNRVIIAVFSMGLLGRLQDFQHIRFMIIVLFSTSDDWCFWGGSRGQIYLINLFSDR